MCVSVHEIKAVKEHGWLYRRHCRLANQGVLLSFHCGISHTRPYAAGEVKR